MLNVNKRLKRKLPSGVNGLLLVLLIVIELVLQNKFRNIGLGSQNDGISFGWGRQVPWLWVVLGVVVMVSLVKHSRLGMGGWLMAAGGFANLISRIVWKGVWDYIKITLGFGSLWINGADVMIMAGVVLVITHELYQDNLPGREIDGHKQAGGDGG